MKLIICAILAYGFAEALSPMLLERSLARVKRSFNNRFYSALQPKSRGKRESDDISLLLLGGEDNLASLNAEGGENDPFATLFGHPGKGPSGPQDNPFAALFGQQAKGNGKGESDLEQQLAMNLFGSLFGGGQQGGNGGNFFQNAMCFQGCEEKFEKLDKYSSASSEEEEDSIEGSGEDYASFEEFQRRHKARSSKVEFNVDLPDKLPFGSFMDKETNGTFNVTEFNQMCGDFIDAKQCLDKCGPGFFTNMFKGVFRPLEYMCIAEKDDFIKYVNCSEEANTDECDKLCGNSTFVEEKTKEMEDTQSIQDAQEGLDEMCTFVQCQLDCSKPKIIESCDNEERAGEVFEGAIAHLIGGVTSTFESVGFGLIGTPDSCSAIASKAPLLPSQIKEQEQEMENEMNHGLSPLEKEKMQLEIEKLKSEIENLKLEMQVLQIQLEKLQAEK